jgi:hypothetical protein
MELSPDEALLLVFRAGLDENAPSTISREKTSRTRKEET